ncbi:MAG: YicC/YloC family endoribonuclease [Pirellulales bacterium]
MLVTLLSMTGFGDARLECEDYSISVEIRTINSRYLKLNLRTTEGFGALESRIEKVAREFVKRGTLNLNVRIGQRTSTDDYQLNPQVLNRYVDQLQEIASQRGLPEAIRLESLSMLPGVIIESSSTTHDPELAWESVAQVVRLALENLTHMRAVEGKALSADLQAQCKSIVTCLEHIESRQPIVAENYRGRLLERTNEAMSSLKMSLEPADLVREVCLFAERADISEETVRLRSHLQQFEKTLLAADDSSKTHPSVGTNQEEAGRKLEFICQEMGRETNTIGSKAADAEISLQVVEIKTALERIREQIQNVQ